MGPTQASAVDSPAARSDWIFGDGGCCAHTADKEKSRKTSARYTFVEFMIPPELSVKHSVQPRFVLTAGHCSEMIPVNHPSQGSDAGLVIHG